MWNDELTLAAHLVLDADGLPAGGFEFAENLGTLHALFRKGLTTDNSQTGSTKLL